MNATLSVLYRHICSEYKNWKMVAALLIGVTFSIFPTASAYITLSHAVQYEIQVLEPYIVAMSTPYQYVALFLGLCLLTSDAPFMNNRSVYEILRIGKRRWFTERMLYINSLCLLYFVVVFFSCIAMAAICGESRFDNHWSSTMHLLAERQPAFVIAEYRLSFPYPRMIRELTPYMAALFSFMLTLLYGITLSIITLFFNAVGHKRLGTIISLAVHIIGYIINANGPFLFLQQLSLLSSALLAYYYEDVYKMNILFTIAIYIGLMFAIWHLSRKYSSRFQMR